MERPLYKWGIVSYWLLLLLLLLVIVLNTFIILNRLYIPVESLLSISYGDTTSDTLLTYLNSCGYTLFSLFSTSHLLILTFLSSLPKYYLGRLFNIWPFFHYLNISYFEEQCVADVQLYCVLSYEDSLFSCVANNDF